MRRLDLCVLPCAGLLVACAPTDTASVDVDRAAVRALIEAEVRAGNAGDPDAFLALFAQDAVAMPPNAPAVEGAAMGQWLRDFMGQARIALDPYEDEELIMAGDWAIHRYAFRWTITPRAGGDPVTAQGKGFHIARRQPDGSWLLTHDIWNTDTQ